MMFRPLAISRQHKVRNFVLFVCTRAYVSKITNGPVSTKLSD